jgi:hypothetical protein
MPIQEEPDNDVVVRLLLFIALSDSYYTQQQ